MNPENEYFEGINSVEPSKETKDWKCPYTFASDDYNEYVAKIGVEKDIFSPLDLIMNARTKEIMQDLGDVYRVGDNFIGVGRGIGSGKGFGKPIKKGDIFIFCRCFKDNFV